MGTKLNYKWTEPVNAELYIERERERERGGGGASCSDCLILSMKFNGNPG